MPHPGHLSFDLPYPLFKKSGECLFVEVLVAQTYARVSHKCLEKSRTVVWRGREGGSSKTEGSPSAL
jgi:hypothetical protein